MGLIRVVWGAATAPTAMAAYDAALAAANVHDYNLVTVSSVIPADADVEVVGTAPDLGPIGERLTVVQARADVGPTDVGPTAAGPTAAGPTDSEAAGPTDADVADSPAIAGLGWSVASEGTGIFYEASGTDRETVERTIDDGLAAGRALRDWDWCDGGRQFVGTEPDAADEDDHACAVVLAVYGESTPLV